MVLGVDIIPLRPCILFIYRRYKKKALLNLCLSSVYGLYVLSFRYALQYMASDVDHFLHRADLLFSSARYRQIHSSKKSTQIRIKDKHESGVYYGVCFLCNPFNVTPSYLLGLE